MSKAQRKFCTKCGRTDGTHVADCTGTKRQARFRVTAKFDRAGGATQGTLTVDRDSKTITARVLRSRKSYSLPLAMVADYVCRIGSSS